MPPAPPGYCERRKMPQRPGGLNLNHTTDVIVKGGGSESISRRNCPVWHFSHGYLISLRWKLEDVSSENSPFGSVFSCL